MKYSIKISSLLLILIIIALSCSGRKNDADRKNIIPKDKMTRIMTDLYISDGLLILPVVHQWYRSADSIAAYRDVIQSHGYTKEEFDHSLRYYFIKRPKQLMKMYEQVLATLSEIQSRYDQESAKARPTDYWTGKQLYASPWPSGSDSTGFDIKLDFANIYYLSFTATVLPADQTFEPKTFIYTCHPDSAMTGSRHYVKTLEFIKDGQPHKYEYQINDPDKRRLRLMGSLFDNASDPALERYFVIEDISLRY